MLLIWGIISKEGGRGKGEGEGGGKPTSLIR